MGHTHEDTWGHKSWGAWGVTWGNMGHTHGDTIHGANGVAHMGVLTCCVAALQSMTSDASWNASRNTWGGHVGQTHGADT